MEKDGGEGANGRGRESWAHGFMGEWIDELMKRHVIRTAVLYFIFAWALTESGTMVAETLEAPNWINRLIVVIFITGFPVAVFLSWIYDIKVTKDKSEPPPAASRKTSFLVLVLILLTAATIMGYLSFG